MIRKMIDMTGQQQGSGSTQVSQEHEETAGVKTLMGDPKKAIIKLAIPMIIAMVISTMYNVVDAFWVSGLGADPLSAVGFFFPFFFIGISVAIGLGMGGGASISRSIGARNKHAASNAGVQTILMMLVLTVLFTIPFYIFTPEIFTALGAGDILELTIGYARVMFAGTVLLFFMNVAPTLLRAEGDAKRSMIVMSIGSILNIILDPIFIYSLDLGVAGAAWATVVSMGISSIPLFYWMFIKKDTYLDFSFSAFSWDRKITRDILKVGIPSMFMQMSMAITMLITNVIIVGIASTDGVAVFSTGWRIVMIGLLPLIGIATAVVSVSGAAFGAKDFDKLRIAYYYALRFGLAFATVSAILTYIFAPQITAVFTRAEAAAHIADDLEHFFRTICIFYPAAAAGMFSSSMFQGTGKGLNALTVTIFRTIILTPPFMIMFASYLGWGLTGVWWGMVVANIMGSIAAFTWARWYISCLNRSQDIDDPEKLCPTLPVVKSS